jgi:hemerythrin superfamily protein
MTHTRIHSSSSTESLHQDHRKIRELLREYGAVPHGDRKHRDLLFERIHRELLIHFTLEEEILYPTLQRTGLERALDSIEEARWGHRLLRQLLTELSQMDSDGAAFDSKMGLLRANLDHYIETEERTVFREVREMSREVRESLRVRLETIRDRLEGEPFGS